MAVLLAVGLTLPAVIVGMHPRWSMLAILVPLHFLVILPILVSFDRLHWRGKTAALALGLPIVMLSMATHRLPASLSPEEIGVTGTYERFEVAGVGGVRLVGLHFPLKEPRGLVVLVHGIGAEKCQFLPAVQPLRDAGFEVYTYDQRNHGESGGWTCTLGVIEAEDLRRVWDHVMSTTKVTNGPRMIYGVSMGGAAAQLAAHDPEGLRGLDGLILDSTFARMSEIAKSRLPIIGHVLVPLLSLLRVDALLTGSRVLTLDPAAAVAQSDATFRVLILHAADDPLIPITETRRLEKAYGTRARVSIYPSASHAIGFSVRPTGHTKDLLDFVNNLRK